MKNLSLFFLLLFSVQIFAQSKQNGRFAWGFFTGLELQSLGVQSLDSREPELAAVRPGKVAAGVSAGFFAQKRIWQGLSFCPGLSVFYGKNDLNFRAEGAQEFQFLDVEAPLHFSVTDWRRSEAPLRGCVIFGVRPGWNLAQNSAELLGIGQGRLALDLGIGAEIKLGNWRLLPAVLYSHGMNNLHLLGNARYDPLVGRAVRDKLSLRIALWRARD